MDNSSHINNDYIIERAIGKNSKFYKKILEMKIDMTKGGGLQCIKNGAPAVVEFEKLRNYASLRNQDSFKSMPQEDLYLSYFCSENKESYS